MCTVCGCAGDGASIEGGHHHHHGEDHDHSRPHSHNADGSVTWHDAEAHGHDHGHGHDHDHDHAHDHHHAHDHGHDHAHDHHHAHDHGHHHHAPAQAGNGDVHYGLGPAHAHAPGLSQSRMIEIETGILAKNDAAAATNRALFEGAGTLALNLVSSPGSGKTTLLCRTIEALQGAFPIAVVEGDQQTAADADRIRATGAPAIQINTGKGCHLDAEMVREAWTRLAPQPFGVLFIENVGNLVCPAAFDLGEAAKVAILSVTEGEDKPLKYPDMFAAAGVVLLNKTDLAPHCDVDLDLYEANARKVNPEAVFIRLSARTGEGMEDWYDWLRAHRAQVLSRARAAAEARLAAIPAAE
ncbi:hydrogenase nickel incorporation protein HypB [Rhodovulum sp. DZ06]|uniref:hydrogenase nickel incorporation protein HypB n=1 Tax=Rhodovulum sp. DZ06 TaxID=3425126 RepID=UPI003D34F24B